MTIYSVFDWHESIEYAYVYSSYFIVICYEKFKLTSKTSMILADFFVVFLLLGNMVDKFCRIKINLPSKRNDNMM